MYRVGAGPASDEERGRRSARSGWGLYAARALSQADRAGRVAAAGLNGLVKGATAVRLPRRRLEAIYFDTPELRLARSGIILRHRTGEVRPP
jgi:hypothetical protein